MFNQVKFELFALFTLPTTTLLDSVDY